MDKNYYVVQNLGTPSILIFPRIKGVSEGRMDINVVNGDVIELTEVEAKRLIDRQVLKRLTNKEIKELNKTKEEGK